MPSATYRSKQQQDAQREVLKFLIGVCKMCPMADDPEGWAETCGKGEYSGEDLADALLDTRHLLESIEIYI